MLLQTKGVWAKLAQWPDTLAMLEKGNCPAVPDLPGRDVLCLPYTQLPGKIGLGQANGLQKLLHDLANIELQAMELGVRTLCEFPQAHPDFREQLVGIVHEEAKHLKMCLQALEAMGGFWGQWPVHLGLWHATHAKDTLLERIFIVHRYLEGSGLDSGDHLLRRLSGVNNKVVSEVVKVIVEEEVGHVDFGSRWFRHYAKEQDVDALLFLKRLLPDLQKRHPRKEKISEELRTRAGFTSQEMIHLHGSAQ